MMCKPCGSMSIYMLLSMVAGESFILNIGIVHHSSHSAGHPGNLTCTHYTSSPLVILVTCQSVSHRWTMSRHDIITSMHPNHYDIVFFSDDMYGFEEEAVCNCSVDWKTFSHHSARFPFVYPYHIYMNIGNGVWIQHTHVLETDVAADVLQQDNWKTFTLITDDDPRTIQLMTSLIDKLSSTGSTFQHMMVQNSNDAALLDHLQTVYSARGANLLNFLVLCQLSCALHVLKLANEFDIGNNNRTAMYMFSKWLLITHSDDLAELEQNVGNLDNVALLSNDEDTMFYSGSHPVKVLLCSFHQVYGTHVDVDHLNSSLTEKIFQSIMRSATNIDYRLHSGIWAANMTRKFIEVGEWLPTSGLNMNWDVFPNRRHGFSKRHFTIATNLWWPFVVKTPTSNNETVYEGLTMDLLREISFSLNFTYHLVEPADGQWGVTGDDGHWSGLVGELEMRRVFAAFAPMVTSKEREQVMQATTPYYFDYYDILMKIPDQDKTKWRTLISVFSWPVMLIIILSLPLMTAVLWTMEKHNPYYADYDGEYALQKYRNAFWYMYGAQLIQGGIHLPLSWSGRTMMMFFWMYCIMVTAIFSGKLIATLTVSKIRLPFTTAKELAETSDYTWGTLGGTILIEEMKRSKNENVKPLWDKIKKFSEDDPVVVSQNHSEHIEKLLQEDNYVYITDATGVLDLMATNCDLLFLKQNLIPVNYIVALQKSSPYLDMFNKELLRIQEGGLMEIWRMKWWPSQNFCSSGVLYQVSRIRLIDVQSAFFVLIIGIGTAMIIFGLEFLILRCKTSRFCYCIHRQLPSTRNTVRKKGSTQSRSRSTVL